MLCSRCGKPLQAGSSFCTACNAPAVAMGAPPPWVNPTPGAAAAAAAPEYAGFWLRLVAYVIDHFVLAFGLGIVNAFALGFARGSGANASALGLLPFTVMLVGPWLYFALLESSAKQGTLGKMALALTVTDANGQRIGFGRATGRFFGKFVSAIPLLIGFLLAGFTARKQALHDMMAGTLVMKKGKSGTATIVVAVVAAAFVGIAIVGVLAAIAIPNFLRYQLRAKAAEASFQLTALARSELAYRQRTGRFVPLEVPAAGTPGTAKLLWSQQDLAAAQRIDWIVDGSSYFRYRVAVDGDAFSACAESDLDGDGTYAAYVLWHPDPAGHAPPAPCLHARTAERSPGLEAGDPTETAVRLTASDVF